jgi:hypothetical protein
MNAESKLMPLKGKHNAEDKRGECCGIKGIPIKKHKALQLLHGLYAFSIVVDFMYR